MTRLTVPPDFPLVELLVLLEPLGLPVDDELDELPHALSATAVTPVRSKVNSDLLCLCTTPPP
jgi:hypothetical protein